MHAGFVLIKKSLFSFMSSRGFFWTLAVAWMMGPLVFLFVWMSAAGTGDLSGYNRGGFVFYYIWMIILNQLTYPTSNWIVGDMIRNGTFSTWLLRPYKIIYEAIAADAAVKIVCMPFILIIAAFLWIFLKPAVNWQPINIVFFILSLGFAQIIRFLLAYIFALLALWHQRADSLLILNDTFVFIFAGQIAPFGLLPDLIRIPAFYLPYRYMLGFPIELLMGKIDQMQIISGLIIQAGWVLIILGVYKIIWKYGIRNYTAVGG